MTLLMLYRGGGVAVAWRLRTCDAHSLVVTVILHIGFVDVSQEVEVWIVLVLL